MIEDDYLDVLGKAMRGHGLHERDLVNRAGIAEAEWGRFIEGGFSEIVARACARVLDLDEDAYAAHPGYHPRPVAIDGVQRLELPFMSFGVNAWWIECGGAAVLFDTGCSRRDIGEVLPRLPEMVCITHCHHDHVGGIGHFDGSGVPVHAAGGLDGARATAAGESLECGRLSLDVLDVSGHFTPAVAYRVCGLDRSLMVVGDALFAGSMGKTASPEAYRVALDNLRRAFAGQPDELLILPGHGPATTLGEERRSNPFLAGMSAVEERA